MLHGLAGGSWGGGAARRPSRAPQFGLQKWRGQTECVPTASRTQHLGGHKLAALLRKWEGWRTKGGRVAESRDDRAQLGGEQRRSPAPSPSPTPQPKSQREPVPPRELACSVQTPNAVLLWSHPSGSGSDSLPLPQGPSERAGLRRPTPSCSVSSTLSDYVPDMTPFPGKSQTAPPPLE